MEFVMRRIKQRYGAVLPLNFFELLDERRFSSQLRAISLLKLGPALGIVPKPSAKLVRGRDLLQPQIEVSFLFREAARPKPVHENAIAIAGFRSIIDAF